MVNVVARVGVWGPCRPTIHAAERGGRSRVSPPLNPRMHTGKRNWPIITNIIGFTFLKMGVTDASFHSLGTVQVDNKN